MLRKLVCSIFVMAIAISIVAAEEFTARITKVEGDKVTFQKYKKAEKGKAPEKDGDAATLPVASNAKITKSKGKFDAEAKKFSWEPDGAIEGGLKNEIFKIEEKKKEEPKEKGKGKGFGFNQPPGVQAQITTSDDGKTITAIDVRQFNFGGLKKKDAKTDK